MGMGIYNYGLDYKIIIIKKVYDKYSLWFNIGYYW